MSNTIIKYTVKEYANINKLSSLINGLCLRNEKYEISTLLVIKNK
jgi:hypothetical protein